MTKKQDIERRERFEQRRQEKKKASQKKYRDANLEHSGEAATVASKDEKKVIYAAVRRDARSKLSKEATTIIRGMNTSARSLARENLPKEARKLPEVETVESDSVEEIKVPSCANKTIQTNTAEKDKKAIHAAAMRDARSKLSEEAAATIRGMNTSARSLARENLPKEATKLPEVETVESDSEEEIKVPSYVNRRLKPNTAETKKKAINTAVRRDARSKLSEEAATTIRGMDTSARREARENLPIGELVDTDSEEEIRVSNSEARRNARMDMSADEQNRIQDIDAGAKQGVRDNETEAEKKARQKNVREASQAADERFLAGKHIDEDFVSLTAEKLAAMLKQYGDDLFTDLEKSPIKAVLLYYLNSGYFRFDQWKEYSKAWDGKEVDLDAIIEEVLEEMQTPEEMDESVKNYANSHDATGINLPSCGSCGLRLYERISSPNITYSRISLEGDDAAASLLQYTLEEVAELRKLRQTAGKITIPIDGDGRTEEIEVWKVLSIYDMEATTFADGRPARNQQYWHLHPELVDVGIKGEGLAGDERTVLVCPKCWEQLDAGKRPKLSISSGIDFGVFSRVGLTLPNLHETLILSLSRLFFAAVKISSNVSGQVNFDVRSKFKCHAILFPQNNEGVAPYICSLFEVGGMFDQDRLNSLLAFYLVDSKGEPDKMARDVFGSVDVFARPWVLIQWIMVAHRIHPGYQKLLLPEFDGLLAQITEKLAASKKHMIDHIQFVDDPIALSFESSLGSDITNNQTTEVPEYLAGPDYSQRVDNNSNSNSSTSLDPGMRVTFVTNRECAYQEHDHDDFRLGLLAKFAGLEERNKVPTPRDPRDTGNEAETVPGDDCQEEAGSVAAEDGPNLEFSPELIDAYFRKHPPHQSATAISREALPINEFTKDDTGLSTSFPHVFMLGKAYHRTVGSLTLEQRMHLLHQFTNVPASDRRLLGYLFDAMQRLRVIRGVQAYVNGNKKAIETIRSLLETKEERDLLLKAIANPTTKEFRALLKKYLVHLKFAGKDIAYGAVESMKLQIRALESNKRYSTPTSFLTISPSNLDNPRSIRVSFRTIDNNQFPAVFEEGCPYGSNGDDFLEYMTQCSRVVSEGEVLLPVGAPLSKSDRAKLAMSNPVAFVQENKTMLNDILDMLMGFPVESDGAYYLKYESNTIRRTKYFKHKKGIAGYPLFNLGCTESHSRGSLHWHFLVSAGISPYVLQRFANVKEVCKTISAVLDSTHVSALPPKIHIATLLHQVAAANRVVWEIPSIVVDSMKPCETLLSRKQLYQSVSQDDTVAPADVLQKVYAQAGSQQWHRHQKTCRNGTLGYTGCRLNMPFDICQTTHAVDLVPCPEQAECELGETKVPMEEVPMEMEPFVADECRTSRKRSESFADVADEDGRHAKRHHSIDGFSSQADGVSEENIHHLLGEAPIHKQTYTAVFQRSPQDKSLGYEQLDYDAIQLPCESKNYTDTVADPRVYELCDVLANKKDDTVIVWEGCRPAISGELCAEPETVEDFPDAAREESRQAMIALLLAGAEDTEGFSSDGLFGRWLAETATVDQLLKFRKELHSKLKTANGYVPAFHPIISYCTGSHNNNSLLGSLGQAKSALFYLTPYTGKEKFPVKQCLSLLQSSVIHVEAHQSTADDSGTIERTTKHVLTRVLNRMNLLMEISDYEVAAALLELPSIITSDRFVFGNPNAASTLKARLDASKNKALQLQQISSALGTHQEERESQGMSNRDPLPVNDENLFALHEENDGSDCSDNTSLSGEDDWSDAVGEFSDTPIPSNLDSIPDFHSDSDVNGEWSDVVGEFSDPEGVLGRTKTSCSSKDMAAIFGTGPDSAIEGAATTTWYASLKPAEQETVDQGIGAMFQQGCALRYQQEMRRAVKLAAERSCGDLGTNILEGLGYIRKIKLKGEGGPSSPDQQTLIPDVSLYHWRGKDLQELNYLEFIATIAFHNKPARKTPNYKTRQASQYEFEESFLGYGSSVLSIRSKQCTPLLVGKAPPHPGQEPLLTEQSLLRHKQWGVKAGKYARYYLTLFRPEKLHEMYSYTWDSLVSWVATLQQDNSIISKFRLMGMDIRMKGIRTTYRSKKMLQSYRGRSRDLWTSEEKDRHSRARAIEGHLARENEKGELEDYRFSAANPIISTRAMELMELQFLHSNDQVAKMNGIFANVCSELQKPGPADPLKNSGKFSHAFACFSESPEKMAETSSHMQSWMDSTGLFCDMKRPLPEQGGTEGTKNGPTFTRAERTRQIANIRGTLVQEHRDNSQQLQLFDTYANYFLDMNNSRIRPPQVVLIHGPAGVGKTTIRAAIDAAAAVCDLLVLKTAFNGKNAVDIGGVTLSSIINTNRKGAIDSIGKADEASIAALKDMGFNSWSVIQLDELSNIAPWHLAHFSLLCQYVLGVFGIPFGGVLIQLFGDLTQLGPVLAGLNLTGAIKDIHYDQRVGPSIIPGSNNSKDMRMNVISPTQIGCGIITNCRWFELNQQNRASTDEAHMKFVLNMYKGRKIRLTDLREVGYAILSADNIAGDDALKWLEAPVVVTTNRERYTLTHSRAINFAIATNTVVIRWMTTVGDWIQRPQNVFVDDALQDPCFYEYFVAGTKGFINNAINKEFGLVNGTSIRYHSIKFSEDEEVRLMAYLQEAKPGDVLTMAAPPAFINVEPLHFSTDPERCKKQKAKLKPFCLPGPLRKGKYVFSVRPKPGKKSKNPVSIPGGPGFRSSKVKLSRKYPVEPAFAITVEKVEGSTLERVILALSECSSPGCSMTHAKTEVAFSRVKHHDHVRLLLTGPTEAKQWESLLYLNRLKPDISVGYFFGGFNPGRSRSSLTPNTGWLEDEWKPDLANANFDLEHPEVAWQRQRKNARKNARIYNRRSHN